MTRGISYIIILFLFISCGNDEEMSNVYYETEAFEYVELDDAFNVYVEEDSTYAVEIIATEDNLLQINVEVENGVLRITDNRKNKWMSPENNRVEVYIKAPPLKKITAAEGCHIKSLSPITSNEFGIVFTGRVNEADLELNCGTFYYWNNHPCGGRLTLTGEVNMLKIWNFALVSVDAKTLTAGSALVENSSKGDCVVTVLNRLEYSIAGEGNICLYGNPEEVIENEVSSTGRLIKF
jgi:hypothetical protein